MQPHRLLLPVFVCCLAAAMARPAAAQQYRPELIIANVTDAAACPIRTTFWPTSVYTRDGLVAAFVPLLSTVDTTSSCGQQLPGLAPCALDDSLSVQSGCCSTTCSTALKSIQEQNCFPQVLALLCNQTAATKQTLRQYTPVLLAAAQRCAGFAPPATIPCPDGDSFEGLVPAAEANVTTG